FGASSGDRVVLAGPRLGDSTGAVGMAATLAQSVGGRFAYLSRRAGDRSALRAGVHPALLPGGRRVEDQAERNEVGWNGVPSGPGRNARAILEAAANREIGVLYLVGVDPLADAPDDELARRAVVNVPFLVVQDIAMGDYREVADAVLPAAAFLEKEGHFSDWEARSQPLGRVRGAPGLARPDWQIFQELSEVVEADLGFGSLEALRSEMSPLLAPRGLSVDPGPSRREPPGGGEGLTLFTYPLLVDEGRLLDGAEELKSTLGQEAFVEVHAEDASRLGLEHGSLVLVRTERGKVELPVKVGTRIAPGAAFVPWNQPGLRANRLFADGLRASAVIEPAARKEEVAS
ncbi:MAG: molybdopterin-dependent oxidoreductase, partial [Actinomycetota bacterium]|nr:molybdopterin-dependent oxidoreductase [Actinomycetota bacterium]